MSQIALFLFLVGDNRLNLEVVDMYGNEITYLTRVSQRDLLMTGCRQTYVLTANQDWALKTLMNVGSGLPQ